MARQKLMVIYLKSKSETTMVFKNMKTIKTSTFFSSMAQSGEFVELDSADSTTQIARIDASGTGIGLVFVMERNRSSNGGEDMLELISIPVFKFRGEFYTVENEDNADILKAVIRMAVTATADKTNEESTPTAPLFANVPLLAVNGWTPAVNV